jgi:importin-4
MGGLIDPYPWTLQIRQLAAVELRKQVTNEESGPWLKVPVELRTSIKSRLLQRLLTEPE